MLWNVIPKLWHISQRRVSETPLRAVCPFLKHHTGKLSYPWSITEFRNELVSQWASLVAQTVTNLPAMQETQVHSLGQEDSLEKGVATTPVFLPAEFHGRRSLVGYSPWGLKESDITE